MSPGDPEQFLSDRRRRRPIELPEDPSEDELLRDYTLSKSDRGQIRRCRGRDNKVGFALQLCVVRRYGRFLSEFTRLPTQIINHLARQLKFGETLPLLAYPARQATESEHKQRIMEYLGLKKISAAAEKSLEKWILSQSLRGAARTSRRRSRQLRFQESPPLPSR